MNPSNYLNCRDACKFVFETEIVGGTFIKTLDGLMEPTLKLHVGKRTFRMYDPEKLIPIRDKVRAEKAQKRQVKFQAANGHANGEAAPKVVHLEPVILMQEMLDQKLDILTLKIDKLLRLWETKEGE